MDDVIERVFSKIQKHEKEEKKYEFGELPKEKLDMEVFYIDGGSQPIFISPSVALYIMRIASISESDLMSRTKEFFCIISMQDDEYVAEIVSESADEYYTVPLDEKSISSGGKPQIDKVSDMVRRLEELKFAQHQPKGALVIDGELEANYPSEKKILKSLFETRRCVCGVSKTSRDLINGDTLISSLARQAPSTEWLYSHNKGIYTTHFVKFHPLSEYVFKVDISGDDSILRNIAKQSTDPVFMGYPYAMLKADRVARIKNKEIEEFRMKFVLRSKDKYDKIIPYVNSMNAHGVLDSI